VPYGYNEGRPVSTLDCDAIVSNLTEAALHLERTLDVVRPRGPVL